MKKINLTGALVLVLLLSSCGGGNHQHGDGEKSEVTSGDETKETEAIPEGTLEITVTSDDNMRFDVTQVEAKAGQKVRLTLKNEGKMPKEVMGHNWTLLVPGTDVNKYGQAAMGAKETDYQPVELKGQLVVSTKMLGPGESETIEFIAPAPGNYPFICTFPGHYGSMRGEMVVK